MGTQLVFGSGAFHRLGETASDLGFRKTLLVTDPGLARLRDRGATPLLNAGITVHLYDRVGVNPDSPMAEAGRAFAADLGVDSIVALGGGSALDAAKAINFLVTNGGRMQDYHGYGTARRPLRRRCFVPRFSTPISRSRRQE